MAGTLMRIGGDTAYWRQVYPGGPYRKTKPPKATTKDKRKPKAPPPPKFAYTQPTFSFNSASFYGLTIPVSLGTRAIVGVPIFSSPLKLVGQARFLDFAVSLGYQGAQYADLVATNVRRIWADDTLIYDASQSSGWNSAAGIDFTLYKGTEDQMPDPTIVSWLGEDQAIAFKGQIYIVFRDFPLDQYNMNHVPVIRAEIKDTFTQLTQVYDTTRIGGHSAIRAFSLQVAVDWYRRRIYQLDTATSVVHCFDTLNMIELFEFDLSALSSPALMIGQWYCEPRFGYIITGHGSSNSCIHYCIDPNSGSVLGQFGADSGAISNSGDHFMNPIAFTEMTQADQSGDAFIVCIGILLGTVGVLRLTNAGELFYAWTSPDDINTIFDVFEVIGEGAINDTIAWACPGDTVESGVAGSSNVATAFLASTLEVTRLVISPDPGGSTASGGFSNSGYQARHDLLWRPPVGHLINWIFRDPKTDDLIVFHRSESFNEMFMSRVEINSNLKGKANPDAGTSGSTIGYATTLWQTGPIPRHPNTIDSSDALGAEGDTDDVDRHYPWWYSQFGSSNTIAYTNHNLDPNLTLINILDGTWTTHDLFSFELDGVDQSGTGGIQNHAGHMWDGDGEVMYVWSLLGSSGSYTYGPARMVPFVGSSGGGIPLYTILGWLMNYAGFTDDELNVSTDLNDTFNGSIVQEVGLSVWDMMAEMSKALQFEIFESEGLVKFTKVGRGSSLAITFTLDPDDDLMSLDAGDDEGKGNNNTAVGDQSSYAGFGTDRDWHSDAPQTVELYYLDESQEYTVNIARANKTTFPISTTENDRHERYDVPLIMSPAKAFVYAARALYEAYAGSTFHEMRLGSKYLRLEPGDVLSLNINDMDYVLKVTEGTINADYSMSVLATSFCNLDAITTTGEDALNNGGQIIAGPAISQGFIIDTPPLDPVDAVVTDEQLRYYSLLTSYGQAGWRGSRLLLSDLANGTYAEVYRDTVTGGTYLGVAASGISGGLSSTTDLLTTLEVNFTVLPGAISGSGFMLLGKPNRWEFIQYGSVVAGTGSTRQYFFTDLVRGLRGTEWHMRDHAPGDVCILYPNSAHLILRADLDITDVSGTIWYKTPGVNEDENIVAPRSFVENADFEKPWAPTSLKAVTISGGSSGLTLSWMRRTRLEYSPLGTTAAQPIEAGWTEQYEIEILGPTGNVLRTVTGALTNSYTYASGDVTTDFGSVPATISFNVYQISPVVGRGFTGNITTDVVSVT